MPMSKAGSEGTGRVGSCPQHRVRQLGSWAHAVAECTSATHPQPAGLALESWLVPLANKTWPHPGIQKLSIYTQHLHNTLSTALGRPAEIIVYIFISITDYL